MTKLTLCVATSTDDKENCYRIRHIVFVEEQGVPVELEIDEHDNTSATHFLGCIDGQHVAASRICVFEQTAKIQRVAMLKQYRGRGLGRDLMELLMGYIRTHKLASQIALDAQTYAVKFYEDLGFRSEGDEFDDAGISHIRMVQSA